MIQSERLSTIRKIELATGARVITMRPSVEFIPSYYAPQAPQKRVEEK